MFNMPSLFSARGEIQSISVVHLHWRKASKLGELVAGVLTHQKNQAENNKVQLGEVERQVARQRRAHQQIGTDSNEKTARALNQNLLATFLLPKDRHAFNRPSDNDHGEEGHGHTGIEAHLVAEDA